MGDQELLFKRLLDESQYYIRNAEYSEGYKEKATAILDSLDEKISANTRMALSMLPLEIFVRYTETLIELGSRDSMASKYVSLALQHFICKNQFYVRALLCQALLEGRKILGAQGQPQMKAEKAIEQIKRAWDTVKKALDIATSPANKVKYQFLVYNASITMWRIVRPYVKLLWAGNVTEILDRLSALMEEADDIDIDWRVRLMAAVGLGLIEANKKPEGLKFIDKLAELVKKKGGCSFEETLIRLRMFNYRDNAGMIGNIKKDCDSADPSKEYKHLFVLQQLKCGLIPEANVDKELSAMLKTLCPCIVDYAEGKLEDEAVNGQTLSLFAQDRVAEASRIAMKYGFVKLCEGCCLALGRVKQSSLRGKIWCEYSKAELILRKPREEINKKTQMKKSILEKIQEDTQLRIDMLKAMERGMIANNRLNDPDIILEGCYLIWNASIPLLKGSTRKFAYKPLLTASNFMEKIQAVNEASMRAVIHLELAKHEIAEDFLSKSEINIRKAISLDYSLPEAAVKIKGHEDDYPGDYQRTYERVLKRLQEQLELKLNIYNEPEGGMERLVLDVENAKNCKSTQLKESLLARTLEQLKDYEHPEFEVKKVWVEEEKIEEEKIYLKKARSAHKQVVLLATEISKQSFEINAFEMATEAAKLAIQSTWEPDKDPELILAQSEAHLMIAQSAGELLLEQNIEIAYEELVFSKEEGPESEEEVKEFTEEQKKTFGEWKKLVCDHITHSVQLAAKVNQPWLICNICTYFWNNYVMIFRESDFHTKIYKGARETFKQCYQAITQFVSSCSFDKESADYTISNKADILAHIALYYAKIEEANNNGPEAIKVCDDLLLKQLVPHLRKHFDSMKARISKNVPVAKAAPAGKAAPPAKGGAKVAAPKELSKSEQQTAEVIAYIELISAAKDKGPAADMLKKAIESMNGWAVDTSEEEELELYAELWTKLGQLAFKQNTMPLMKTALVCAENASKIAGEVIKKYKGIPSKRLRWYALARFLYGDVLRCLVDPNKQEKESQEQLLMNGVDNFVEAADIAREAGIGMLVMEAGKRMWNTILPLLSSRRNRVRLMKPLCKVTECLYSLKESSDPDFLSLFYAATFGCITENKQWKLGEERVEEAFQYVPSTHHRVLWEAKVLYLSKQGKNVIHAVSSMKEATASLQAKVWLKLARSSTNISNQYSAYVSAIDILKKDESVEVVEVIIELAEWLLRYHYPKKDIEEELLYAVDVLLLLDPKWEEEEDEVPDESEQEESQSKTRSKLSSGRSKLSRAKESKKGKDMRSKVSGKSRMSKKSVTRTPRKSVVSSSKKSTLTFSRRGEEEARPLYLGCSHYDKLFRIHTILALLSNTVYKQREYLSRALNFMLHMWQSSVQLYQIRKFIETHKEDLQQRHGYKLTSTSHPGVLDQETIKFIIADILNNADILGPPDVGIPFDEQHWISFELPSDFLEIAKTYQESDIFSYWSFIKPSLSFYYMNQLLKLFENYSMRVQKIPVLKTLIAFSDIVAKDNKLSSVYKLHLAREYAEIGCVADPKDEEQTKKEQDRVQELLDSLVLKEEEKRMEYENIKLQSLDDLSISSDKEPSFVYRAKTEPYVLEHIARTHERWILQAIEHIYYKRFVDAKQLLDESAVHCTILNDYLNYTKCMHLIGWLFNISQQHVDAIPYHYNCEKYLVQTELMSSSVCLASRDLTELHRYSEARNLIDNATETLRLRLPKDTNPREDSDIEVNLYFSLLGLHLEHTLLCMAEVKEYLNIPLRFRQLMKLGTAEYKKAEKVMGIIGGASVEHIQLATQFLEQYYPHIQKLWNKEEIFEKKQVRLYKWIERLQELLIELKCYKGVDTNAGSKLRMSLDENMERVTELLYKVKGQTEILKAPPPPDPPKPEEKQEEEVKVEEKKR